MNLYIINLGGCVAVGGGVGEDAGEGVIHIQKLSRNVQRGMDGVGVEVEAL